MNQSKNVSNSLHLADDDFEFICLVCGVPASHVKHYGSTVCYSCRAFFRRSARQTTAFKRFSSCFGNCLINPSTRTRCKACRYLKCLQVGMVLDRVDKRGRKVTKQQRRVETNNLSLNHTNNVHHHRVGDTNFTITYRNDSPILTNAAKTTTAQNSIAENVFTASLANVITDSTSLSNIAENIITSKNQNHIITPNAFIYKDSVTNHYPDTATGPNDNVTNTTSAPNLKNVKESNASKSNAEDSEKAFDQNATVSFNAAFPSFDLTAEEELKIHMLFQVREKTVDIITQKISNHPDSCQRLKLFLHSIAAPSNHCGQHSSWRDDNQSSWQDIQQTNDLQPEYITGSIYPPFFSLNQPGGKHKGRFSLGSMAMRIPMNLWPSILDFRDIYHKVELGCLNQVSMKSYPIIVKLYHRLLLKVNVDSDGFLEQHRDAGLLTPSIQNLYNHAVAGSDLQGTKIPSFNPFPFETSDISTASHKGPSKIDELVNILKGDRVLQNLIFFMILFADWPDTLNCTEPDHMDSHLANRSPGCSGTVTCTELDPLRMARNEINLLTYRYLKLKKGLGPDLANQTMENIISSLYQLYQFNQRRRDTIFRDGKIPTKKLN